MYIPPLSGFPYTLLFLPPPHPSLRFYLASDFFLGLPDVLVYALFALTIFRDALATQNPLA